MVTRGNGRADCTGLLCHADLPDLFCAQAVRSPLPLDVSHVWGLYHRLRHHACDERVEFVVSHLLALRRHQGWDGGGLTRHRELARAVGPEGARAPESRPTRGPQWPTA